MYYLLFVALEDNLVWNVNCFVRYDSFVQEADEGMDAATVHESCSMKVGSYWVQAAAAGSS